MTILCCAVDKENQQIVVGTDTLWTWPGGFSRDMGIGSKVVLDEPEAGVIITGAGGESEAQVFQKLVHDDPKSIHWESKWDIIEFAFKLREKMKESGAGDANTNSMPEQNAAYLIGHGPTEKVYMLDDDYSVTEFSDYTSSGCGFVCCEPVMDALYGEVPTVEAVKRALEITMVRDPYCGGATDIRTIPFGPVKKSLAKRVVSKVKGLWA